MRTWEVVAGAVLLVGGGACGGAGMAPPGQVEGAASPEQAVEVFLEAARQAQQAKAGGAFGDADRAYERMAAVFGTERGTIRRSYSAEEVRGRMLVLAACLRPSSFRILTQPDPAAWQRKRAGVTVELTRGNATATLPFRLVLGRQDRWFIEQIDLASFSC